MYLKIFVFSAAIFLLQIEAQDNVQPLSVQKIKEDFEKMDIEKDGYLSAGDFRRSMAGITEDDITYVFDKYDGNRDGVLNFEEFLTLSQDTQAGMNDQSQK